MSAPIVRRVVGAGEDCDLRIADAPYLSTRHFALVADGDLVQVEDLGSMNGTEVYVPRVGWIKACSPVPIRPGCKILAGRVLFKIGEGGRVDVVRDVDYLHRDTA